MTDGRVLNILKFPINNYPAYCSIYYCIQYYIYKGKKIGFPLKRIVWFSISWWHTEKLWAETALKRAASIPSIFRMPLSNEQLHRNTTVSLLCKIQVQWNWLHSKEQGRRFMKQVQKQSKRYLTPIRYSGGKPAMSTFPSPFNRSDHYYYFQKQNRVFLAEDPKPVITVRRGKGLLE